MFSGIEIAEKLPKVTCGRCCKPVDEVRTWRDELMCNSYLVIRCHGEQEKHEISDELMCGAEHVEKVDYVAFAQRTPELMCGAEHAEKVDYVAFAQRTPELPCAST